MDQPNFPASVEQLKQSVDTLGQQVDKLYGQAAAMAVQHTGAEQTFLVMGVTVFSWASRSSCWRSSSAITSSGM